MSALGYCVQLWGSDPDEANDDCWEGHEVASETEARELAAKVVAGELDWLQSPGDYVVIARRLPDVDGVRCFDPLEKRRIPGRRAKVDRDEWRREIAREEGMLGGVDAYNDWSGY